MKNVTRLLSAIILAAAVTFIGLQIQGNGLKGASNGYGTEGISVVGEGKSSISPDTLNINLSVSELEKTTELAQKQSNEKIAKVQEIISTFAIEKKDVQTTNATINPEYDRSKEQKQLLGYRANQNLSIKINGSGFEQKGADFIAKISEIGGVSIDNTSFSITDENKGTEEAREKAFKDAQNKAEQLAKLAGVKLGKVSLITEQTTQSYPTPMYAASKEMMVSDSGAGATALSAGETEVSMTVSVNYEIR